MDRGAWQATVHRVEKESDTTEVTKQQHTPIKKEIKSFSIWPLEISLRPPPPKHKALEKLYLSKVNSFLLLGYILLYEFMRVWYGIFESLFYIYESLFKHAPVDKTFGLFPIWGKYK